MGMNCRTRAQRVINRLAGNRIKSAIHTATTRGRRSTDTHPERPPEPYADLGLRARAGGVSSEGVSSEDGNLKEAGP
ncbi:hypothetical protein EYF80_063259 [Liparis tanakae]|uniref:Uncharacterized protein n=1 Tax=Liparis tanakae TaxID=230148 RepID=A0A4Z2ECM0_9TELE|nr:hypothetical protein EYF80_063259 [Liparis tanakae]